MTARVLFVGWDGADWSVLDPMQASGVTPTFAGIRRSGSEGTLNSTFPPHSVAAWSSFLTALPAGRHLVVDFLRAGPGEAFPSIPNGSADLPRPTLLEVLSDAGARVVSANIPMTFPPSPVNGFLVSGVFLPADARYTYPDELQDWLESRGGFATNAMGWTRSTSLSELLREAKEVTERHTAQFVSLVRRDAWDVALFGYMAPDRIQHAAMHLLDPRHPANEGSQDAALELVVDVFRALDSALARLIVAAQPHHVVIASDHGFRPVWRDVVPNALLEGLGYLRRRSPVSGMRRFLRPLRRIARAGPVGRSARRVIGMEAEIDWSRTRAYAPSGTCWGVRLNVTGRDPRGSVPPARFDATLDVLLSELRAATTPEGHPCFSSVVPAAEIAPGLDGRHGVPDAFYVPSPGLGVAMAGTAPIRASGRKSGEHRREGIVVRGEAGTVPGAIQDLPVLITDLVGVPRAAWTPGDGGRSGGVPMTDEEIESIVGHLRGLGYVD